MNTRILTLGALFAALVGCGNAESSLALQPGEEADSVDEPDELFAVRVDVFPPETLVDEDGAAFPPQTVATGLISRTGDRQVIDSVLSAPVAIEGEITGWEVTPMLGTELPGYLVAVGAQVSLFQAGSIQSYTLRANGGAFDGKVVAGEGYEVRYVPDDPQIPFASFAVDLTEGVNDLSVGLGSGALVWGQVRDDDGQALAGIQVRAESEGGLIGASTTSDDDGWYQLRVVPGASYTLVATGLESSGNRDPVVRTAPLDVGAEGLHEDVAYGVLDYVPVGGRIVDEDGVGLANVTVRLEALNLTSFDEGAQATVEVVTSADGFWDTRTLRGRWHVELLPSQEVAYSPTSLDVDIDDDLTLPLQELERLKAQSGRVLDEAGLALPGARVTCREVGFGRRWWTADADEAGTFGIALPEAPVRCAVVPPAGRQDLATLRVTVEDGDDLSFALPEGTLFEGSVNVGAGEPVKFAWVEIRSADNELIGSGLTDDQGRWSARVLPE